MISALLVEVVFYEGVISSGSCMLVTFCHACPLCAFDLELVIVLIFSSSKILQDVIRREPTTP